MEHAVSATCEASPVRGQDDAEDVRDDLVTALDAGRAALLVLGSGGKSSQATVFVCGRAHGFVFGGEAGRSFVEAWGFLEDAVDDAPVFFLGLPSIDSRSMAKMHLGQSSSMLS